MRPIDKDVTPATLDAAVVAHRLAHVPDGHGYVLDYRDGKRAPLPWADTATPRAEKPIRFVYHVRYVGMYASARPIFLSHTA